MQKLLLVFLSVWMLLGCKENAGKTRVVEVVNEFVGSELKIPSELRAKINGRDTICDYLTATSKILVYIDSTGCSPCKMELAAWTLRMEEMRSLGIDAPVVFVVYSNDYTELEAVLRRSYFEYPIFYDPQNQIVSLNPKLKYTKLNTFLLDKDNKVVLIGSPANNEKLWELYKDQIERMMKD